MLSGGKETPVWDNQCRSHWKTLKSYSCWVGSGSFYWRSAGRPAWSPGYSPSFSSLSTSTSALRMLVQRREWAACQSGLPWFDSYLHHELSRWPSATHSPIASAAKRGGGLYYWPSSVIVRTACRSHTHTAISMLKQHSVKVNHECYLKDLKCTMEECAPVSTGGRFWTPSPMDAGNHSKTCLKLF